MPTYERHRFNGPDASGLYLFSLDRRGTDAKFPSAAFPGVAIHTCPLSVIDVINLHLIQGVNGAGQISYIWTSGVNIPDPFNANLEGLTAGNSVGITASTSWNNVFEKQTNLQPGDVLFIKVAVNTDNEFVVFNGEVNRIVGQTII